MDMKKLVIIGGVGLTMVTQAGTMGDLPRFSGLWAGVGGSYINTTTHGKTNLTMVSTSTFPAEFLLDKNLENHLSPIANAGYLFDLPNQWLMGIKGFYKYIGSEQFDQSWSGTFQNGTYQTAGLHTKLNDEYALFLINGYQFDHWIVYGGMGPSVNTVTEELNGAVLLNTSLNFQPVNISKNHTFWGGAGQVGFEYLLPNRFMVDISYNLVVSSNQTIPSLIFPTGNPSMYTSISQSMHLVEQGINISVNKYFM